MRVVTDSLQVKKTQKNKKNPNPEMSLFLNFHSVCIEKHLCQFWPSAGKEYISTKELRDCETGEKEKVVTDLNMTRAH